MAKKCRNCGFELADNMNFCPKCHQAHEQSKEEPVISVSGKDAPGTGYKQSTSSVVPPVAKPNPKGGAIKGVLVLIGIVLVIALPFVTKYLQRRTRAEGLGELLVKKAKFPKGNFEVRHLDGDRYGVFVTKPPEGFKVSADKPAFVMVFDSESRKFRYASAEDKTQAQILSAFFNLKDPDEADKETEKEIDKILSDDSSWE